MQQTHSAHLQQDQPLFFPAAVVRLALVIPDLLAARLDLAGALQAVDLLLVADHPAVVDLLLVELHQ
jgi:hypothetical protein